MAEPLIETAYILLNVAWWIIIVQAILSWLIAFNVINTSIWIALDKLTEPLYRPIRRFMPDLGGLDLSPMVVLIIIIILQGPVLGAIARATLQ